MSTRRVPAASGHRCGDSAISSALAWTERTKRSPRPGERSSYQAAAFCSSASAIGLKRTRLLATEALFEAGEDLLGGDRFHAACIDVVDASLDLGLPIL